MTDSKPGSRHSSAQGDLHEGRSVSGLNEVSDKQRYSPNVSGKEASAANNDKEVADCTQFISDAIDSHLERCAGDPSFLPKDAMICREGDGGEIAVSKSGKANVDWDEERIMENAAASAVNVDHATEPSSTLLEKRERSVSLRAWLSNSERVIDYTDNLHVFKQVTEFVELAHSQGVVLRNVRPSSFLLSSLSRISTIESASSQTSSSSSAESNGKDAPKIFASVPQSYLHKAAQLRGKSDSIQRLGAPKESESSVPLGTQREGVNLGKEGEDSSKLYGRTGNKQLATVDDDGDSSSDSSSSSEHADDQVEVEKFPLKEILSMEVMWYKSPEELAGETPDFSSDIYNLGVILAELFYRSGSQGERSRAMSDLRHRLLPPSFLLDFPKESAFCLLLLHPNPHCRPKAREILRADIFSDLVDKLAEREAIMHMEEKLLEAEATLDFLWHLQEKKEYLINKVVQELSSFNGDIEDVKRWQSMLLKNSWNSSFQDNGVKFVQGVTSSAGSSKLSAYYSGSNEDNDVSGHTLEGITARRHKLLFAKSAQLHKSFTELREVYLSMISVDQQTSLQANEVSKRNQISVKELSGKSSFARSVSSVGGKMEQGSVGRLGCFFDDFCHFMKYSKLDVKSTLQYGDILNTKNMVCSLSFDCDDDYFATAGVSKRIKIFDCNALLEDDNAAHFPVIEMNSKKKLSCVCWNKFRKNVLSSSDLEGAVQVWDVTTGQNVLQLKEHSKCAWSVDFSHFDPSRMASGSDDRCVKLWSINQATSTGTIKTKANICSVQFPPGHSHILAFGSADSQVYFHDLRYIRIPVCILTGHQKAVSFVRFVDDSYIVSASTDNTLKLWDVSKTSAITKGSRSGLGSKVDCAVTYSGHTNVKNFVGLSVGGAGYIACGSETDEVYVYHKSLPMPMLSHKFKSADPISGEQFEDPWDRQFVSSVCWRNKSLVLVIGNSVGNIQVLEMV